MLYQFGDNLLRSTQSSSFVKAKREVAAAQGPTARLLPLPPAQGHSWIISHDFNKKN